MEGKVPPRKRRENSLFLPISLAREIGSFWVKQVFRLVDHPTRQPSHPTQLSPSRTVVNWLSSPLTAAGPAGDFHPSSLLILLKQELYPFH